MADFRAIATITDALRRIFQAEARRALPSAEVRLGPPNPHASPGLPLLHLRLASASPDPDLRNVDLPTRDAAGSLVRRPRMPLRLRYLLVASGEAEELHPELLIGSALALLAGRPNLGPRDFEGTETVGLDPELRAPGTQLRIEVLRPPQAELLALFGGRPGLVLEVAGLLLDAETAAQTAPPPPRDLRPRPPHSGGS